jgi:hypothetical protein
MAEAEYLLHLSKRIGYLKEDEYIQIEELRKEGAKTLHGLIIAVNKEVNK